MSLQKTTEMFLDSGGIPIIAHSYRILIVDQNFKLEDHMTEYKKTGITGLETHTQLHTKEQESHVKDISEKHCMIYTGAVIIILVIQA